MYTHSGVLKIGKKEEQAMRCVLKHCQIDMNYGGGGSFSKGDNDNTPDLKEIGKACEGIKLYEWILETYKK